MDKRITRKKTTDTGQLETAEREANMYEGLDGNSGETDLDTKEVELTGLTMSALMGMDLTQLKRKINLCLEVIKGRTTKIHQALKKMQYGIGDCTVVCQTAKIGDIANLIERKIRKRDENSNTEKLFTRMGEQMARIEDKIEKMGRTRQTEKPHMENKTSKLTYAKALQNKTEQMTTGLNKNKETTRAWTPPDKNKQKNEVIVSFTNKTGEETKTELKNI
ncbi:hypothetical protein GWI33_015909 [Rhynchophorus ferrugineus]|uniref:Uncharacterized protein n=1 Tax=Rhynchophorus ferrugineus TaxID=354439 RepID=A0A834HYY5_RHYFE|nr:hypothetical protein GWI33_015909 [Rhynchophorus ferrugineus]